MESKSISSNTSPKIFSIRELSSISGREEQFFKINEGEEEVGREVSSGRGEGDLDRLIMDRFEGFSAMRWFW